MASIRKYRTAKGYAWRVQYRSPDRKSRTKQGFRTKAEAEYWASVNLRDMRGGTWTPESMKRIAIREYGDKWVRLQERLKPSSKRVNLIAWEKHVEPKWGCVAVGDVRASDVELWVADLGLGATSVRRAHGVLAQVIDLAVKDGAIPTNPARGIRLPTKPKVKPIYLSMEQLNALASACFKHGEIVWLLGTTGLRWGELAALRVQDIDLDAGRIEVERNAVTVGNEVHIGTPKGNEARSVAVPRFVAEMLRPLCAGRRGNELVWSRDGVEPLKLPTAKTWYFNALERVRAEDTSFPRVTPHGLRHVAAGLMVQSGAHVKVVQRQLGHQSAAMTLDVYAGLFDGDLDEMAGRMNELAVNVVGLSCDSS